MENKKGHEFLRERLPPPSFVRDSRLRPRVGIGGVGGGVSQLEKHDRALLEKPEPCASSGIAQTPGWIKQRAAR